jgi:hypothetical protein
MNLKWRTRASAPFVPRDLSKGPRMSSSKPLSQVLEDFIENYLLKYGYPLTDFNRARARNVLNQDSDSADASEESRTALLDLKMGIGFR